MQLLNCKKGCTLKVNMKSKRRQAERVKRDVGTYNTSSTELLAPIWSEKDSKESSKDGRRKRQQQRNSRHDAQRRLHLAQTGQIDPFDTQDMVAQHPPSSKYPRRRVFHLTVAYT